MYRAVLFAASVLFVPSLSRAEITAHTDFEGASAKIVHIDQATATVRLMPAGNSERGWPCWWSLRLEGLTPGNAVTLELLPSDQLQHQPGTEGKPLPSSWSRPDRPAISNEGSTWLHGPPGKVDADAMVYRVVPAKPVLWVGWGPLFTPKTAQACIDAFIAAHPEVERFTLATTREGRPVPALRIGAGAGKPVIWLQARQHAWESGGSYVWKGAVAWLLSDDPLARQLRQQAEIVAIPMMDIDHVTSGDGGKDALPQDHNRDWSDAPHWPEVAAAQRQLLDYAKQKRLRVFCDLHNPSAGDKKAYFYVSPKDLLGETGAIIQDKFLNLARKEFADSPILLELSPRESGPSYHPLWKQISKNWVHAACGHDVLALTLETAWNTPASTVEGYEKTGANLGRTLARFMASH